MSRVGKTGTVLPDMKTVAAIHDISCHSKSSLTVVIPTLAALGVQASVLPTALLSTHTDGYENYAYVDLTETMEDVIAHWKKLGLQFDSIYSGFLGSHRQIDTVSSFIGWQRQGGRQPLVVVDPVLGDQGKPYGPMTSELIARMHDLVTMATVITPNLTEAALLLGEQFTSDLPLKMAEQWAKRLSALGPRYVAITSVMDGSDGIVVAYDADQRSGFHIRQTYAPVSYPGCGDFFASILCALLVRGLSFFHAVEQATDMVNKAVYATWKTGTEIRSGVAIELVMSDLVKVVG